MKYFEIEGASPEEALNNFINETNYPKDFLTYEIIDEGKKGFLGIGKKRALIKILFNDIEYSKRKAKLILSDLLEKAGFQDFRIETKEEGENYILNIVSPDSNLLIGKMAQTLDALQYLLDKMIYKDLSSDLNIIVDVENYRFRVVKHLKDKAAKLASKVKKTGRPERLSPMVTIIRKEIHMAIKSIPGVKSNSSGNGNIKALYIIPEKIKKNFKKFKKVKNDS
jgi:spoIIIJ-associated protein